MTTLSAPYVKVYLLDNGTCKAKKKTKIARKTLEPLYQQHLLFDESPQGKVLQVMITFFHESLFLWENSLKEEALVKNVLIAKGQSVIGDITVKLP